VSWASLPKKKDYFILAPGQAKVCEFDDAVTRDEQVLRLQVAMNDAMTVKEVDATQNLPNDVLNKKSHL
jgi:hypothetical protein